MNATATQTLISLTTLSPALCAGLARILEIASKASVQSTDNTDLLNALSAIQSAVFAAEMEHFGQDGGQIENEADIPF